MSRKKVIKKAKATKVKRATATTAKRPAKKATHSTAQALEKAFRETPAKLVSQSRKTLAGVKQQEKKLLSDLKKHQGQQKAIQQKSATLATKHKTKPTATGKNQLAKHKQALDKVSKIIAGFHTELTTVKTHIRALTQQQNKHIALQKMLSSFDKEWEIQARKAEAEAAAKAKPRKKAAKKPSAAATPAHNTTTDQEPNTMTNPDLEHAE